MSTLYTNVAHHTVTKPSKVVVNIIIRLGTTAKINTLEGS